MEIYTAGDEILTLPPCSLVSQGLVWSNSIKWRLGLHLSPPPAYPHHAHPYLITSLEEGKILMIYRCGRRGEEGLNNFLSHSNQELHSNFFSGPRPGIELYNSGQFSKYIPIIHHVLDLENHQQLGNT